MEKSHCPYTCENTHNSVVQFRDDLMLVVRGSVLDGIIKMNSVYAIILE